MAVVRESFVEQGPPSSRPSWLRAAFCSSCWTGLWVLFLHGVRRHTISFSPLGQGHPLRIRFAGRLLADKFGSCSWAAVRR